VDKDLVRPVQLLLSTADIRAPDQAVVRLLQDTTAVNREQVNLKVELQLTDIKATDMDKHHRKDSSPPSEKN
jgi:hypothetical protein